MYMRIKEVMNKYKVTRKALLLYEERGLIQPDRELSGYRDYRLVESMTRGYNSHDMVFKENYIATKNGILFG